MFRVIANIALNYWLVIHVIDVADKLNFHPPPRFGYQWQIVVANVALFLQLSKGALARLNVLKETYLPKFLSHQLIGPVTQQFRYERIGLSNLPGPGLEYQDAVLSCLEKATKTHLAVSHRDFRMVTISNVVNGEKDQIGLTIHGYKATGIEP